MQIVRCEGLTKIYQTGLSAVRAVDGVSIALEEGSFTAVTGPSGSGKSTLLHLLSGLDAPSAGKVFFRGADLNAYRDNQLSVLRRRRFGFVFQNYNLVRELTGRENILLPVMLDGRRADEEHIRRLTRMLDIEDRLDHLPGEMSGGEQQRVSIARALANKPAVLFADEPTGNLDGRSGREVLSLLGQLNQELGVTLLLVTHDMNVAEQAGRVVELRDGRVARDSGVAQP